MQNSCSMVSPPSAMVRRRVDVLTACKVLFTEFSAITAGRSGPNSIMLLGNYTKQGKIPISTCLLTRNQGAEAGLCEHIDCVGLHLNPALTHLRHVSEVYFALGVSLCVVARNVLCDKAANPNKSHLGRISYVLTTCRGDGFTKIATQKLTHIFVVANAVKQSQCSAASGDRP